MAKVEEYRGQSDQELEGRLGDLRHELFELRNEKRMSGKLEKPHRLAAMRREIARVMTVMAEKKR